MTTSAESALHSATCNTVRDMTDFASLPVEVIEIILKAFSVSDRKYASLVCRRWRASFWHHSVLLDCDLLLQSVQLISTNHVRNPARYLTSLRLDQSTVSPTWQLHKAVPNLSLSITTLSLRGSNISEQDLYFLLSCCSRLSDVSLSDLRCTFTALNDPDSLDSTQNSKLLRTTLKSALRQLESLQRLDLKKCTALRTSGVLRLLRNASATLAVLDLSDLRFSNVEEAGRKHQLDFELIAEVLGKCGKLRDLRLARTNVTDYQIQQLGEELSRGNVVLTDVSLSGCGAVMDGVAGLFQSEKQLQRVDVSGCRDLSAVCLQAIAGCERLITLGIGKLPKATSKDLARLHRHHGTLKLLDLSECSVPQALQLTLPVGKVATVLPLQVLNLKGVAISDAEFCQAIQILQQLVELNVSSCFKLTDAAFRQVGTLRKLRTLCTSHCSGLSSVSLSESLVQLDLSYCARLSASTFEALARCRSVRKLSLSGSAVRDHWLAAVARSGSLEQLELQSCEHLTDQGVRDLCIAAPRLRSLNLQHCETIRDASLRALQLCKLLRVLDVSFCPKLTREGVEELRSGLPCLTTLVSSFD